MRTLTTRGDMETLRVLAAEVAEIAALPRQQATKRDWSSLNGLGSVRPMVLIDEIPWHEMGPPEELELRTQDEDCQRFERVLRRTLYMWRHLRVDMVVEAAIDIPKVIKSTGFGLEVREELLAIDPRSDIVSHGYRDQLADEGDVSRIKAPVLELDSEATARIESKANEAFDGLLEVRMQGWLPSFELWDDIVHFRGAQRTLFDLAARPDHMHAIASRYTDARMAMLRELEEKGLLGREQATVHCTGAFTDDLPAAGYDPERPRAKDLWTFGMAQILGSVSPAMFEEFELPYASLWYERFGLVYYGCCEPLHERIHLVRRIPNVRKISMSPWADVDAGAEAIGRDFVFSYKPNPAHLAREGWHPEVVEHDLRMALAACRRSGSPIEITLKDISTIRDDPRRLWEWAAIATRVVRE